MLKKKKYDYFWKAVISLGLSALGRSHPYTTRTIFFYRFTPLSVIASLSRVLTGLLHTFYLLVTDNQWRTTCHPQYKRIAKMDLRS